MNPFDGSVTTREYVSVGLSGARLSLTHRGDGAAPRPVVQARFATGSEALPTSVEAGLTFGGSSDSAASFSTSGHAAGRRTCFRRARRRS